VAGIAIKPTENVDIAVDVQQVLYSGVASVSNPLLPNLVQAALGDDAGAGFLAPGVMEQHLTFGFSKLVKDKQEISLAITRAFSKRVTGPNPLEVPGLQSIRLQMDQWDFELCWSFGIKK